MPAPIPFDAPVTTATFPFNFPFFICVPFICLCLKNFSAPCSDLREPAVDEQLDSGAALELVSMLLKLTCPSSSNFSSRLLIKQQSDVRSLEKVREVSRVLIRKPRK